MHRDIGLAVDPRIQAQGIDLLYTCILHRHTAYRLHSRHVPIRAAGLGFIAQDKIGVVGVIQHERQGKSRFWDCNPK